MIRVYDYTLNQEHTAHLPLEPVAGLIYFCDVCRCSWTPEENQALLLKANINRHGRGWTITAEADFDGCRQMYTIDIWPE